MSEEDVKKNHSDEYDEEDQYSLYENHILDTVDETEEEEEEEEEEVRYEITARMVIRLKQTFEHFDTEKREFIPTKLVGTMMRFVGFTPTDEELKLAIARLYIDPRGTIDFQKFFQVVQMIARDPEPEEDIIELFHMFDEEDKGFLLSMDLREILMTQGDKLKEEEMVEFLKIADKKKNGKIKYESFVTMVEKMANKMPPILDCDQPPPPDPKQKGKLAIPPPKKK